MKEWVRYQESIGQGCVTNSKHPRSHVFGVYPQFAEHCRGSHIHGNDGVRYLDYICGLGTNLFGYNNERINAAISNSMATYGASPSFPTKLEWECGEKLKEIFPWVQKWKYLCSGSEACSAAVIIARALTGRRLVLSDGYHGWHSEFTSLTPPGYGCPVHEDMEAFARMDQLNARVAALIIEADRYTAPQLVDMREMCDRYGIFLIFDEVITGYRYLHYSVAQDSGVRPDLFVIGKAMANGEPMSAVGGSEAVMDAAYFVSSTYAGNTRRLSAAIACVDLMLKVPGYENQHLWNCGGAFKEAFNSICDWIKIEGYNTRGVFKAEPRLKALFFQEAAKANILFCASWFYNWGHIPHLPVVIHSLREICGRIERMEVDLEGDIPVSPLSMQVRGEK